MKKLKTKKGQSGITLIALLITIIVLLILAGVSINLIVGENGIVSKAQQAKEKMDFASVKENIEMEIVAIQTENITNKLTESEIIDKLVEKGIVAEDRKTFVSDSNYTISPNGNIFFMGKKVNKVEISDSESTCVVKAEFSNANVAEYLEKGR